MCHDNLHNRINSMTSFTVSLLGDCLFCRQVVTVQVTVVDIPRLRKVCEPFQYQHAQYILSEMYCSFHSLLCLEITPDLASQMEQTQSKRH